MARVIVVGAGIFGVCASYALSQRKHTVSLIDPGPIPHPLAASTDISKAIRMDYGTDEDYTRWMEESLEGWRNWNKHWDKPLFHETGVLYVRRTPMAPGTFEGDSYATLTRRGHLLSRLDSVRLRKRFPAWSTGNFIDGYYHRHGGWAESGNIVTQLLSRIQQAGVQVIEHCALAELIEAHGKISGIRCKNGQELSADRIVVCAGSWTGHIVPWLREALISRGMPVFHLAPEQSIRERFTAQWFPTFGADIANTGYYGFPLHPSGVVKIAHHGPGIVIHPESIERVVSQEQTKALREFLKQSFPALSTAEIESTRMCLYSDTHDGHFWIDEDPQHRNLIIAAGGSGHAFKFAPVLGDFIADVVEEKEHWLRHKFRWRPDLRLACGQEAARYYGETLQ